MAKSHHHHEDGFRRRRRSSSSSSSSSSGPWEPAYLPPMRKVTTDTDPPVQKQKRAVDPFDSDDDTDMYGDEDYGQWSPYGDSEDPEPFPSIIHYDNGDDNDNKDNDDNNNDADDCPDWSPPVRMRFDTTFSAHMALAPKRVVAESSSPRRRTYRNVTAGVRKNRRRGICTPTTPWPTTSWDRDLMSSRAFARSNQRIRQQITAGYSNTWSNPQGKRKRDLEEDGLEPQRKRPTAPGPKPATEKHRTVNPPADFCKCPPSRGKRLAGDDSYGPLLPELPEMKYIVPPAHTLESHYRRAKYLPEYKPKVGEKSKRIEDSVTAFYTATETLDGILHGASNEALRLLADKDRKPINPGLDAFISNKLLAGSNTVGDWALSGKIFDHEVDKRYPKGQQWVGTMLRTASQLWDAKLFEAEADRMPTKGYGNPNDMMTPFVV